MVYSTASSAIYVSIHAPARGATPRCKDRRCPVSFNPRAREGRDTYEMLLACERDVSIHAPARGATAPIAAVPTAVSFNPRAREGRDSHRLNRRVKTNSFNPRAREGRDSAPGRLSSGVMFQSTRPRGARRKRL